MLGGSSDAGSGGAVLISAGSSSSTNGAGGGVSVSTGVGLSTGSGSLALSSSSVSGAGSSGSATLLTGAAVTGVSGGLSLATGASALGGLPLPLLSWSGHADFADIPAPDFTFFGHEMDSGAGRVGSGSVPGLSAGERGRRVVESGREEGRRGQCGA